jgi:UDP-glucose 4-epimerase
MTDQTILITGVAAGWGARLAARLTQEPGLHVIGLDDQPPRSTVAGLDFVQADVRNPALVELLASEKVQVVCHLKFAPTARPSRAAFDVNVKGATNVLNACAGAGVSKVVLKSSTLVYGAHADNPAFLTESHALRGDRRCGTVRDLLEIEGYCAGWRRQSPDVALTVLRFANIVGPCLSAANTLMSRFLKQRLAPAPLGSDPLLQVIHADDVVEALAHAVLNDAPGVFNVAAEGVLPLLRVLALARKPYLPLPYPLLRRAPQPFPPAYLRYAWVADLARMRDELGFAPHYTAEETLRDFVARGQTSSEALAFDARRLRSTVARRLEGEEHG